MNVRQSGAVSLGSILLLVGGAAVCGLLVYGAQTGQELPFWPAILVVVVNLVGAAKLVLEIRERKRLHQAAMANQQKAKPSRPNS